MVSIILILGSSELWKMVKKWSVKKLTIRILGYVLYENGIFEKDPIVEFSSILPNPGRNKLNVGKIRI